MPCSVIQQQISSWIIQFRWTYLSLCLKVTQRTSEAHLTAQLSPVRLGTAGQIWSGKMESHCSWSPHILRKDQKTVRKVTNSSGYYPPKKRHQVSTWIRLQVTLSSLKLTPLNLRDLQKPKNQWMPRYLWQRWFTFYKQNSREKVRIYKGGSLASEGRQTMNFYRSKAALILQPTVHTQSPPLKWKTHFHNFTFHLHAKLKALLSPKVHLFRE